jgi:uncharacterized protein YcnI
MKNGQLWYNIDTERVERVVGTLNKTRMFTVSHGYSELKPVKRVRLQMASGVQVQDYLRESRELKKEKQKRELTFSLPPLPTLPQPSLG